MDDAINFQSQGIGMQATIFKPPHGRTEVIDLVNVLPADAEYFESNGIQISLEETGGQFVIYADCGLKTEDGEPNEMIEIAAGRTCEETLSALRLHCEAALADAAS